MAKDDMAKKACRLWVEENKKKKEEDKEKKDFTTDIMGSYTGVNDEDPCETPQQDADDL